MRVRQHWHFLIETSMYLYRNYQNEEAVPSGFRTMDVVASVLHPGLTQK